MNPCIHFATQYDSPLGPITLLSDGADLVGLYFPTQLESVRHREYWRVRKHGFDAVQRYLDDYFSRISDGDLPPLRLIGTAFQQLVWNQLLTIRFGQTRTYGEIAKAISRPTAARAVGKAIGDNPLSILVPCHRVIGRSGALTGYAGGLDIKRWLLNHEGSLCQTSCQPDTGDQREVSKIAFKFG